MAKVTFLPKSVNSTLLSLNRHIAMKAAYQIQKLAKERAPVKTGYMRDHIHVVASDTFVSVVSLAPYSIYVHETMGLHHEVGGPKFLEEAAMIVQNQYMDILNIEIQYEPFLAVFIVGESGQVSIKQLVQEKMSQMAKLFTLQQQMEEMIQSGQSKTNII